MVNIFGSSSLGKSIAAARVIPQAGAEKIVYIDPNPARPVNSGSAFRRQASK